MSLYSEYLAERGNKTMYETDKGFIVYSFTEDALYIEDCYIRPDFRRTHVASDFGDYAAGVARFKGKTKLLGSIVPNSNGATESMKMLLAYGFQLDSSSNNFIILKKDV